MGNFLDTLQSDFGCGIMEAPPKDRMDNMKSIEEFVKGKKNAYTTKSARLLWAEDKVRTYQNQVTELRDELKNDAKTIEDMDAMVLELGAKQRGVETAQKAMAGLASEDVPAAIEALVQARTEVTDLEAKIRSKYYAR